MPKKYLSLSEAAAESGRSYWTLREAALTGALKTTRFSKAGKYYISTADLKSYFRKARRK